MRDKILKFDCLIDLINAKNIDRTFFFQTSFSKTFKHFLRRKIDIILNKERPISALILYKTVTIKY
jgi:hypothetical protein